MNDTFSSGCVQLGVTRVTGSLRVDKEVDDFG
jgi:hypothetical protein